MKEREREGESGAGGTDPQAIRRDLYTVSIVVLCFIIILWHNTFLFAVVEGERRGGEQIVPAVLT